LTTLNELLTKSATIASQNAFLITVSSLVIGIGFALLLSLIFSTRLSKRIQNLEQVMESMAQKDISIESHDTSKDELGKLSRHINMIIEIMQSVSKLVESRLTNLEELQKAIAEGFDEADKSSEILSKAKHELEGISEISDMIADVAGKTNILSMNAAIESAHAGISGKGFAVVAEEIRKLSDTASENASNIEKLVKNIAVSLSNSSQSAEQSRAVLAATREMAESFVSAFYEIGSAIKELNQASKEILEAVGNIKTSSLTIKQEGPKAAESSKKIEQDLAVVKVTSEQVVLKIARITESINTLSSALEQMNSLVTITNKRSSELNTMLCEFRVEQACVSEHETENMLEIVSEEKHVQTSM